MEINYKRHIWGVSIEKGDRLIQQATAAGVRIGAGIPAVPATDPTPHQKSRTPIKDCFKKDGLYHCSKCGKTYKRRKTFLKHFKTCRHTKNGRPDLERLYSSPSDILDEAAKTAEMHLLQEGGAYGNIYRGNDPAKQLVAQRNKAQRRIDKEIKRAAGRRKGGEVRAWIVEYLSLRDGGIKCRICGGTHNIEVDHINGDPTDYRSENLCFLCKNCNLDTRVLAPNEKLALINAGNSTIDKSNFTPNVKLALESDRNSGTTENVRGGGYVKREGQGLEGEQGSERETRARQEQRQDRDQGIDSIAQAYKEGTGTMQAAAVLEPRFRQYVIQLIRKHKSIKRNDLIYAGAEYTQCSPRTAERYLTKMTNPICGFLSLELEGKEFVVKGRECFE